MNYRDGFGDAIQSMVNFQQQMNVIGAQDECLTEWRELSALDETEYAEGYMEGITAMVDLQLGEQLAAQEAYERCVAHMASLDAEEKRPLERRRLPSVAEE